MSSLRDRHASCRALRSLPRPDLVRLAILFLGTVCLTAYIWVNAGHDRWGWALVGYIWSNIVLILWERPA